MVKCPVCGNPVYGWLSMTFDYLERVGPATLPKGFDLRMPFPTKSGNCELAVLCEECQHGDYAEITPRLFVEVPNTETLINQTLEKALENFVKSHNEIYN